jgi:hypothetical protein
VVVVMVGVVVMVVLGGLVGCSTYEPPFRRADLAGMVYSTDFLPVAEARVSVDGSPRTLTDRAGRFQISGLAPGSHVIRVTHSEHLPVRLAFSFHDRTQLLHVSLEPVRELEEQLVKLLAEGRAQQALDCLQGCTELPDTISLLKAVALTRTGRFDRALSVVRDMGGAEALGDLRARLRRYIRRSRAEVEP